MTLATSWSPAPLQILENGAVAITCSIENCGKPAHGRGWCGKHYSRWMRQGDPTFVRVQAKCAIKDCDRDVSSRGWCELHYRRWRKQGDPLKVLTQRQTPVCELGDCDKPSRSSKYCRMHTGRLNRYGSLDLPVRPSRTRRYDSRGYAMVKRPDHPIAVPGRRGWLYEHRAIVFDDIGPGWHPCHHCGTQVSWDLSCPQDRDALVVDHLDEDRTNNDRSNLVPSCASCNITRSSLWVKRRQKAANQ